MGSSPIQARTLSVAESAEFWVHAQIPWNDSGLNLIPNGKYDLVVLGSQTWSDGFTISGADGYLSRYGQPLLERFRRIPNADWLELIGTIGKSLTHAFIVGTKLISFSPPASGRLYCFANDVRLLYWNNSESIKVIVTRIG